MAGSEQMDLDDQQASGASLFWALACIVLNAMSQPSFCGTLWHSDEPGDSPPWLYRSSPTICLLDAVADTWIMVHHRRNAASQDEHRREAAKPTDIAVRMILFIFTVVPQAIKIFSIRGIWLTQTIVVLFLVPSLVSMARSLCLGEPQKDLARLIEQLRARGNSFRHARRSVIALGWALHGVLAYVACSFLSRRIHIPANENVIYAMLWVDLVVTLVGLAYIFLQAIVVLVGFPLAIPRQPIIVISLLTGCFGILDMMHGRPRESIVIRLGAVLLFDIMLCSYLMTLLLDAAGKVLVRWFVGRNTLRQIETQAPVGTEAAEDLSQIGETTSGADSGHGESDDVAPPYAPCPICHPDSPPPYSQEAIPLDQQPQRMRRPESINGAGITQPATQDALPIDQERTPAEAEPHQASDPGDGIVSSRESSPGSKGYDEMPLYGKILIWTLMPPFFLVLALSYLHEWVFSSSDADDGDERRAAAQETAERGEVSDETGNTVSSTWRQGFIHVLTWPIKFLLRIVMTALWRSSIWGGVLYGHTFWWMEAKLKRQSKSCLMLALTVSNFSIVIIYYLVAFDGRETFTPSWTKILSKT